MRRLGGLLGLLLFAWACATGGPTPPVTTAAGGGQILVTLPPAPPALLDQRTRELAELYGLQPLKAWNLKALGQRCVVFATGSRNPSSLLRSLAADPRVAIAQPIQRFETLAESGSYRSLQHAADQLHIDAAHQLALGRGVRIAIVDSGVDIDHPELRGRVEIVRDFAAQRLGDQVTGGFTGDIHGTAVAGVIAAADDGQGIVGVAPAARLLALKACWPETPQGRGAICDSYTLALALDFAVDARVQVINLSLGGPRDPLLEALIAAARERGQLVVGAVGHQPFPGELEGVLAIRAFDPESDPGVATLSAPGDEILSTVPGGTFDFFTGSSLAAAHVSGIAALLLEHRPQLKPAELAALLRRTTHANPGHQLVDACLPLAEMLGKPAACG